MAWPPYCGTEMLPHAVGPDGHPWPVVCVLDVHIEGIKHESDEPRVIWPWQRSYGEEVPNG